MIIQTRLQNEETIMKLTAVFPIYMVTMSTTSALFPLNYSVSKLD